MNKFFIIVLLAFGVFNTACTTTTSSEPKVATQVAPELLQANYQAALEQARQAYKKVDDVGFAWRDTEKMIKESESAAKSGDLASAIKLANKAHRQSTNAWEQYIREQNSGPRY